MQKAVPLYDAQASNPLAIAQSDPTLTVDVRSLSAQDEETLAFCKAIANKLGCQIAWREDQSTARDTDQRAVVFGGEDQQGTQAKTGTRFFNLKGHTRRSALNMLIAAPQNGSLDLSPEATSFAAAMIGPMQARCVVLPDEDSLRAAKAASRNSALDADRTPDFMTEERAVVALMRNPARWSLMVCRPQFARIAASIVTECERLGAALPGAYISEETVACYVSRLDTDAAQPGSLLEHVRALVLLFAGLGMARAAKTLEGIVTGLFKNGLTLEGTASALPYSTEMTASDFKDLILDGLDAERRHTPETKQSGLTSHGKPSLTLVETKCPTK